MKPRIKILVGGVMLVVGYILSPLSWWNDLVVNIPISYAIAWLAGLFNRSLFIYAFIGAYWLSNVAGLILMHRGSHLVLSKKGVPKYTKKELLEDMLIALGYTALIITLIQLDILKPFGQYLPAR